MNFEIYSSEISWPKISIVTPSFNQGEYIDQTILSVINQGYPNLEYIIIDGGSSDNTVEIIKKYTDRISYWVSEPDKGQSDALNKGLSKCTGDIFNWINSDDYLEPNALYYIASSYNDNPDADIFCGYSRMFQNADNSTILNHRCKLYNSTEETIVMQQNDQQGMFYKLSALKNIGLVNDLLHYVMDLELWFRYLVANGQSKFVYIDKLLAHFRIHGDSKTSKYELGFKEEEKMLWFYMISELKLNRNLIDWFKTDKIYTPVQWNFNSLNHRKLETHLLQYHFYSFYHAGNKTLTKIAFKEMFKMGRVKFAFHYLALFVKIYLGNFSFRKYFKY